MILWINGAFGAGKTTTALELNRRLPKSFIYDPENVGAFIRSNTNGLFSHGDFQDIPLWREINYKLLRMAAEKYDGVIIVPMTLVNPTYYNEIIGRLAADRIEIKHYILYAKRSEVKRRLKKRALLFMRNEAFALNNINRCTNAFDKHIKNVKIHTDGMDIDAVVEAIAKQSGLKLTAGRLSKFMQAIRMIKSRGQ
ncbi:MAG: tunicamycin resistance protein [Defluviitaleaceae bacterium]|nr:tunicamycin resistance protein [Defluviitaleaceae bacterium]